MFDWLFGAKCPVTSPQKVWLEKGLDWLGGKFGVRRMLARPIILPTPEYFPDPYDGTFDAARRLFERVCGFMEVNRDRVVLSSFTNQRDRMPLHLREGRSEVRRDSINRTNGVERTSGSMNSNLRIRCHWWVRSRTNWDTFICSVMVGCRRIRPTTNR